MFSSAKGSKLKVPGGGAWESAAFCLAPVRRLDEEVEEKVEGGGVKRLRWAS